MNKFSERLKTLRLNKGLSINDLSKEININPKTIQKWENNLSKIRVLNLIIIADYFNVSVDYLIGLEN